VGYQIDTAPMPVAHLDHNFRDAAAIPDAPIVGGE
jgi:hypothetical protein